MGASETANSYAGDAALDRLLARQGTPVDAAAARAIVAGVLAAPAGEDPEAWLRLVLPNADSELRAQLLALKADLAAVTHPRPGPAERLEALRAACAARGVDGFIVPRADEHQGEYVPPRAQRLAWLTGFTGSAGLAIVLADRAAIFTDGRYTLQVRDQVDGALYAYRHLIEEPPAAWIAETLQAGQKLGYDPWLHAIDEVDRLRRACEKAGASLVACADNPLDAAWTDQPPPPLSPVVPHDEAFAGESSGDKRAALAEALRADGVAAAVLTMPDSIAWLLNIRGADIRHVPLPLSFAVLRDDARVDLFIDRRKVMPETHAHLGNQVSVHDPDALGPALDAFGGAVPAKVLVDPRSAAGWVYDRLQAAGATVVRGNDPCAWPKARKNPVELEGTRAAHRRDGAALSRFLAWLDAAAPGGELTEIDLADRLRAFRREGDRFRDLSFPTISGAGPNGAIIHYGVTPESNRRVEPGMIYLVDSGAQYLDGTTDVTRTVLIGGPPQEDGIEEVRDRFTRVLKGHIAIATMRFPKGTTGSQLDPFARQALWQAGLDYDHGTGHGVGSYLSVHEGPQRISKATNAVALEPGMIVSNEPGYYKAGAYGIRIENLVTVVECEAPEGAEKPLYGFETLTLAPIDLRLVAPALLTAAETDWLDAYHARVRETLSPQLDADAAAWLTAATRPLAG